MDTNTNGKVTGNKNDHEDDEKSMVNTTANTSIHHVPTKSSNKNKAALNENPYIEGKQTPPLLSQSNRCLDRIFLCLIRRVNVVSEKLERLAPPSSS